MDAVAVRSSFWGFFFNHSHLEVTQSSSSYSFSVLHFPCFNRGRLNNSSKPQTSAPKCSNCQKVITRLSISSPVVRNIRDLASTRKWVSIIRSCSYGESISDSRRPSSSNPPSLKNPVLKCNCSSPVTRRTRELASSILIHKWVPILQSLIYGGSEDLPRGYLQNGGLGMALLSATSTARVRISPFVATLAANPTFVSALFAWFVAQSIKVVLNFFVERKWDLRMLFACGGMPSSHSALCTALTASVALCHGVADSLFPVCLGFSLIVMYDAIGVRRHAGMQAEVLNVIVEDLFQGHPISQRKLKELLGHTPSQVFAGAVLGVIVACVCCNGCLAAI